MPTTRTRRTRTRKSPPVAPWVDKYVKDRIPPGKLEPGYQEWIGWYFFGDHVEGLPSDWHQMPPKGCE